MHEAADPDAGSLTSGSTGGPAMPTAGEGVRLDGAAAGARPAAC
ncbi:hypothetical protein [Blastococcus sp. DSM 46786]|nr:hypothetical protein [Blastococcus sp. DSM 46786]